MATAAIVDYPLRKQLDEGLAVEDFLEVHKAAEDSFADQLTRLFTKQKNRAAERLRELGYLDIGHVGQLYGQTAELELMEVMFRHADKTAQQGLLLALRTYNRQLKTAKSLSYQPDGTVLLEVPKRMMDSVKATVEQVINAAYVKGVAETARKVIQGTIQRGIKGLLSHSQVADEIVADSSGAFSRTRAMRIARTETTSSIGLANYAVESDLAQDEQSASTGRQLLTIGDADVRDHHVFWNRQQIRFTRSAWELYDSAGTLLATGNQFQAGNGERARWPGDPMLSPGNRIHCRCVSTSLV